MPKFLHTACIMSEFYLCFTCDSLSEFVRLTIKDKHHSKIVCFQASNRNTYNVRLIYNVYYTSYRSNYKPYIII